MNLKSAHSRQNLLQSGGFVICMVRITVSATPYIAILGLAMMAMSIVVWWMYHRCPYCHEQLGRGNPKRCPKCGAWVADEPEPEEKKKIQHKKKKH